MGHSPIEEHVLEGPRLSKDGKSNDGNLEKAIDPPMENLLYDNIDEEPAIHLRTWIALGSMFLMNFVQTFALQGPPSVVS